MFVDLLFFFLSLFFNRPQDDNDSNNTDEDDDLDGSAYPIIGADDDDFERFSKFKEKKVEGYSPIQFSILFVTIYFSIF